MEQGCVLSPGPSTKPIGLPYFIQYFSTVEINASFYRMPTESNGQEMARHHASFFLYSPPNCRVVITHIRKLHDAEDSTRKFLDVMAPLDTRRGPILIQLPPSMRKNVERLDEYLNLLERLGTDPWRLAVEFRHPSWLDDEVRNLLDRHKTALCIADLDYLRITEPNNVNFVYVRRHGPGGDYGTNYPADYIAADAARISAWLDQGRDVYVYYNNDAEAHAVENAAQLMHELGIEQEALVDLVHHR